MAESSCRKITRLVRVSVKNNCLTSNFWAPNPGQPLTVKPVAVAVAAAAETKGGLMLSLGFGARIQSAVGRRRPDRGRSLLFQPPTCVRQMHHAPFALCVSVIHRHWPTRTANWWCRRYLVITRHGFTGPLFIVRLLLILRWNRDFLVIFIS